MQHGGVYGGVCALSSNVATGIDAVYASRGLSFLPHSGPLETEEGEQDDPDVAGLEQERRPVPLELDAHQQRRLNSRKVPHHHNHESKYQKKKLAV